MTKQSGTVSFSCKKCTTVVNLLGKYSRLCIADSVHSRTNGTVQRFRFGRTAQTVQTLTWESLNHFAYLLVIVIRCNLGPTMSNDKGWNT